MHETTAITAQQIDRGLIGGDDCQWVGLFATLPIRATSCSRACQPGSAPEHVSHGQLLPPSAVMGTLASSAAARLQENPHMCPDASRGPAPPGAQHRGGPPVQCEAACLAPCAVARLAARHPGPVQRRGGTQTHTGAGRSSAPTIARMACVHMCMYAQRTPERPAATTRLLPWSAR